MPRVGILGLGAIGHVVAAQLLEKSGLQCYYFNRSPRAKLVIRLFDGQLIAKKIVCATTPSPMRLDWLIICLKAYHYPAATPWFAELIGPTTKVLIIRNGLELSLPLKAFAPSERLLPGLIDSPTQQDPAGGYYQLQSPKLILPEHPLTPAASDLFYGTPMLIETHADFKTVSWEKLCASAALGAITCLTGQPCRIFRDENILELFKELVIEGINVATADGAKMGKGYLEQQVEKIINYPPNKGSSMLNDRLRGYPVEVVAKNGVISRLGKKYGIPTPLNDQYTALLQVINQ